jgi:hypothetical protein
MEKSSEPVELELHIDSRDEDTVSQVESTLTSIDVKRWPAARMDPVTVLAIAAATVKLITAVLELKAKLAAQHNPPKVNLVNASGAMLNVATATQSVLEDFLHASK